MVQRRRRGLVNVFADVMLCGRFMGAFITHPRARAHTYTHTREVSLPRALCRTHDGSARSLSVFVPLRPIRTLLRRSSQSYCFFFLLSLLLPPRGVRRLPPLAQ